MAVEPGKWLVNLLKVSEMMEDAQSMQVIRHSCLRDRVIAGMARKSNAQRKQQHDSVRKRGRPCGTGNSALGEFFARIVLVDNSMVCCYL